MDEVLSTYGPHRGQESAPHSFLWGDDIPMFRLTILQGFNPRPTVSCGATSLRGLRSLDTKHVSIRAPQFPVGRRWSDALYLLQNEVSIRAPQFPVGRHPDLGNDVSSSMVSIRAPQFPVGRRYADLGQHGDYDGFNPRPTVSCGATRSNLEVISQAIEFQSAPHSFLWGDESTAHTA